MSAEPVCGADIVIKALVDQGVDVVFGYPGGAVLPIYDSLYKQNHLRHILVRQEGGAVHAAEGYARSTGRVGVVLVTSGPGATNAVTGLTDALMDSVPVVCLTGQVPTHLIGNDAFQEADTTGITRPCTKHNYLVKDVNELARTMHEAFYVAKSGRPGPVVIDLPKDVLFALGQYAGPEQGRHKTYRPQLDADPARIEEAAALIAAAKKPLFYGGGGIVNSGAEACARFAELVRLVDAPCTLTLMGLGAFPASDPHFLGMVGMHGLYESNMAMHDCDVMIAVGSRFDDRVTGRLNAFAPNSKKIHIDIDPSSLNKNVRIDVPLLGDCGRVLTALLAAVQKQKKGDAAAKKAWWREIGQWRGLDCLRYDHSKTGVIKPQYALERLYELTKGRNPFITTEVGQHQMWAAQFFKFDEPFHWMTSGGLGTMGYGLPAAMGVQVAHPDALVIDIAGEASILMNIQEMSTIAQYRLPVKAFILNNHYMGMVRQWQELLHGARYSESYTAALPDFVKLADAFGGKGMRVENPAELDDAIRAMLDHPGAFVLDVAVEEMESCFPMIPSGAAHNEMLLGPADKAESAVSEEGMVLV
jgi:acetolactate synthase-1/2/3 large subunit